MENAIEMTGPAVEYVNGEKDWYLNNILYGINDDFSYISWSKFVKTLIFSSLNLL